MNVFHSRLGLRLAGCCLAVAVSACSSSSGDSSGSVIVPAVDSAQATATPTAAAPAPAPTPVAAQTPSNVGSKEPLFGANLSGAEASGGDAIRPTLADLQGYIDHYGFKLIRYPFIDKRMTPERIVELRSLVDYARSRGVPMILDNHTYKWTSVQEMVDFWTTFARHFPDDGSVMLDLVNEPKGFNDPVVTNDWLQWIRDAKLIVAGLRANGIKHPILLEYPQWSASFRFDKKETEKQACVSAACAIDRSPGAIDPIGRTFINAHRYFDKDSSGTDKVCAPYSSGWGAFAEALRKRGLRAYITEAAFGSSSGVDPSCVTVGAEAIATVKANSDVLLGVTWWGGGRLWPDHYIFKIEPPKAQRFTGPVPAYALQLLGR
jgi:hypothetical protein